MIRKAPKVLSKGDVAPSVRVGVVPTVRVGAMFSSMSDTTAAFVMVGVVIAGVVIAARILA